MKNNQFGLISEININDQSSWQNKTFISIDIDWAHDDVIRNCASLLIKYGVKATWYVTHATPVLAELRENELFELGIHPNFNKLLNCDYAQGKNIDEVFTNILKIVPEAKSFRSHSLTQSTPIIAEASEKGLLYDLNTFIPISSDIEVCPYMHTCNILQLPHIWEDDVHYMNKWNYEEMVEKVQKYKGLKILDFHPIHIYLNTENIERYNAARPHLNDMAQLKNNVNNQCYGTRNFFKQIIK